MKRILSALSFAVLTVGLLGSCQKSELENDLKIADILPEDFPIAEAGGPDQPGDAWLSIAAGQQCYLSVDGSLLCFYNASGNPEKLYSISTEKTVSAHDSLYVCKAGNTVTITFTKSEGLLTSILFEDTAVQTWNGTYEKSACIAAGTMITMSNGERKSVEQLQEGDVIRTFDHKTGEVSSSPVCLIMKSTGAANAFTLKFDGGIEVTVIEEHGFYDLEENRYAFINPLNAKGFIGHHFYDADNGRWLELKGYEVKRNRVDAYALVSSVHLNHLSNGMLSMCDGSIKLLANLFEYDSRMAFDAAKKEADIETYGLTPLEKVLEFEGFTEANYHDYNLQYLNVAIGKGLISWECVKALGEYCAANWIDME